MVSYFIKVLLLIMPLTCFAWDDEEPEKLTTEYVRYLERANFRMNNLYLLQIIVKDLKAIRCQGEESDYCDNIEQIENEEE